MADPGFLLAALGGLLLVVAAALTLGLKPGVEVNGFAFGATGEARKAGTLGAAGVGVLMLGGFVLIGAGVVLLLRPARENGVRFTSVVGAAPGGVASATVETAPGASCSIVFLTPKGTKSEADGLVPQTASADGTASWNWSISAATNPGVGTVTVTCACAIESASIRIG